MRMSVLCIVLDPGQAPLHCRLHLPTIRQHTELIHSKTNPEFWNNLLWLTNISNLMSYYMWYMKLLRENLSFCPSLWEPAFISTYLLYYIYYLQIFIENTRQNVLLLVSVQLLTRLCGGEVAMLKWMNITWYIVQIQSKTNITNELGRAMSTYMWIVNAWVVWQDYRVFQ